MYSAVVYIYWILFVIAVIALMSSIGLFLFVSALVLIPVLLLHLAVGIRLSFLHRRAILVFFSSLNLVSFALIRPDGVHAIDKNGLTELLDMIDVNLNFQEEVYHQFLIVSIVLLVIQLGLEVFLLYSSRPTRRIKV